jgi:type IV pilus assembly protein PilP
VRKRIYCLIILCLLFLFAGCKKEQAPVIKGGTTVQVQPPTAIQEGKVAAEVRKADQEIYTYDPRGKRDPFLSLVTMLKQRPERKRGMTPFESYSIDEINLLAIAWDDQKYYALIMLPDKKSYTITEGMKLGIYGGKVQKITKDMVIIREYVKDYRGEIKLRDSILKLRKEGDG